MRVGTLINPLTAQFIYWLLDAVYYNVRLMDSNTSSKEKKFIQDEFNATESNIEILITTYRFGSQAMDLQYRRSTIVLFEAAVNTNIEIQATGRARRTGQRFPQTIYRLYVDETFNGYQEMKQLEKRLGEYASWGGDDIQEAMQELLSTTQEALLDDKEYFRGVQLLDMHIKGQASRRANQEFITGLDQRRAMLEYRQKLRDEVPVV